jgi:hypothetical protein
MVRFSDYEFRFDSPEDKFEISVESKVSGLSVATLDIQAASGVATLTRIEDDADAIRFTISAPQLFNDLRPRSEAQEYVSITAEVDGKKCSEIIELRLINESMLRIRPEVQFLDSSDRSAIRFVVNSPPSTKKDFKLKFDGHDIEPQKTKHLSDVASIVIFELPEGVARSEAIRDGKLLCCLVDAVLEGSVKILFK